MNAVLAAQVPVEKPGMFTLDSVPWMRLGKITSEPLTAHDAVAASGLNFDVTRQPVYFRASDGSVKKYDNRFVIERLDTREPLGVVTGEYEIIQYREAFDFMDTVSPRFVAAGTLNGGRQGFMVVEVPDVTIKVLGDEDPHQLYAVLRTSHDRTRAVEVVAMPLRHICMNQLTLKSFGHNAPHRWSIRHTRTAPARLNEATQTLENLSAYARFYEETAQRLALTQMANDQAMQVLTSVLPAVKKKDEVAARILDMWHADQRVNYGGTGWGLVQAVSTYYEHERFGGTPQSRFLGAIQGQTQAVVSKTAAHVLTRFRRK